MRTLPTIAAALAASALAGAAFAQQAAPPSVPPPPSPVYPETNGGLSGQMENNFAAFAKVRKADPTPVFAVVGDHLLSGEARPDANGIIVLRDAAREGFLCAGRYRDATVRLACSDGKAFTVALQSFSDDAGFGHAVVGSAKVSLCYGFRAKYAAQRLSAPAGYRLSVDDGQLTLLRAG